MKRVGKNNSDETFLKDLGKTLAAEIQKKGYDSPYDFWIQKCDGEISRQTLNNIIRGKIDPKVSTLRAVARLLKVNLKDLI